MKNKISIITVTKNSEKYIKQTMDSVINQFVYAENINFDLEYIIHDGNSSDGTKEIITEYANKYNFINFSSFEDMGLFDGIAYCLKKVTGNIVAYINSGDLYSDHSFQLIVNIFNKEKKINWITGSKFYYNENSEIIDFYKPYRYRRNLITSGVYGKYLPFIQQESTFWRAGLNKLIDLKYLKTLKLSGDYFIWFSFAKEHELYILNSFLSGFKYHKNQLTFRETGKTDIYLNEINQFRKRVKIKDILYILYDSFFWFILKYLQSFITKKTKRQLSFDQKFSNWSQIRNNVFCWLSEFNSNQGEGILGKMFLESLSDSNSHIEVKTPKQYFILNEKKDLEKFSKIDDTLNKSLFEKYIYPLIGIIYCWIAYFKNKKVVYINYIPLWNILIFGLCPPNTLFGPITGGIFNEKVKNLEHFARKFIMPVLYKLSLTILKFRKQRLTFSTENLKEKLDSKIIANSNFNYFLNNFQQKTINEKKDIDFIIYNRPYPSKNSEFLISIVKKLCNDFNIFVVGDPIKFDKITNLGKIPRKDLGKIIQRSKFTILSAENFSSLFAKDCIEGNTCLFYNENNLVPNFLKNEKDKKIFSINYADIDFSYQKILQIIKLNKENLIYSLTNFNFDNLINEELDQLNK